MSGLSLDPAAATAKHTLTAASLKASGHWETTHKHGVFSNASIRVRWEGAVIECGCLVTLVPGSVHSQEVRSLSRSLSECLLRQEQYKQYKQ